eukprot:Gregarina_sp_Poly_1__192@NODE_1044_length_5263_cov_228_474596_g724_i0_p2_GENE_NODE_1044_length_5263_cov_228_474596_g724_i0NODE_1044_length_5263_cov_228_474596_g724_i0_p2_ORF_typecomplete_len627_score55_43zfC3HC4_2/PF13923_6/1_3e12zfC3HC4_3/PF13920_6/2_5e10zfC3HC4_4/PF15227_6/8_6e10zfRING_5/PF14634_6/3_4e08zfC3HC4/PF00097_25/5_9e08zfRING_UBOX/PF13445_6/2_2e07LON_substr_bdg/PF02190_16/2_4e07Ubox/PF04564_15/1e06ProkRING_4/PF14447_6/5_7e02ProkRING_4/PF14447_6/1_4e06zfRING_2/PF13639_6/9_2e07zfRING_6/
MPTLRDYDDTSEESPSNKGRLVGSLDSTEDPHGESVDVSNNGKKIVDRDLECPICIKLLFKPVSTACGHTFCQVCLEEALEHRPQCPLCREPINGSGSCHENRLVQSLIAKQYPEETKLREQEIETSLVTNDLFARSRRRDLTLSFLNKHKKPEPAENSELTPDGDSGEPPSSGNPAAQDGEPQCETGEDFPWKPVEVPIIYQNYKYELPFPSDYVELYFEAPMYLDMVADVMANLFPGFVMVLESHRYSKSKRKGKGFDQDSSRNPEKDVTRIPEQDSSTRKDELENNDNGLDTPSSDDMSGIPPVTNQTTSIGVMIEIQQCLTFNDQHNINGEDSEITDNSRPTVRRAQQPTAQSEHSSPTSRPRSALQTLFTSVRSPPTAHSRTRVSSWVPRRLYQHRLKIRGNRRDMWRQLPESNLFPEGCCIIRGECVFRTLVNKGELQCTSKGYMTAPVTPLFDAPLSYGSSVGLSSHRVAESLTRSLNSKVKLQLAGVCPAGRLLFQRKFGSAPPLLPRPNSIYLEYWSMWASKILQISARRKAYFMSLNDTVDRLRKINQLLDGPRKQHMLALGLSSTGTESFGWMLSSGPCGSLALGVILFLFLVAASLWHRFGWDQSSVEWPFYSV